MGGLFGQTMRMRPLLLTAQISTRVSGKAFAVDLEAELTYAIASPDVAKV